MDLLECMDVIDVFVNTQRLGGAGSGNDALFLGKPVITVKKGDVYACVGDDFAVGSLDEYNRLIRRYFEDKDFYKRQSERAFERYKKIVTDDEKMMEKAKNVAVKRLIYAVIIFLVPVIIRFTFKILGNSLSTNNLGLDGPAAGIKCFNDAWDSL